jgi:hypothetical protein
MAAPVAIATGRHAAAVSAGKSLRSGDRGRRGQGDIFEMEVAERQDKLYRDREDDPIRMLLLIKAIARTTLSARTIVRTSKKRNPCFRQGRAPAAVNPQATPLLEHDPEKWIPVFGKDHAPPIASSGRATRREVIPL